MKHVILYQQCLIAISWSSLTCVHTGLAVLSPRVSSCQCSTDPQLMLSGTEVEVRISVNGWGDYKEMVASMAISVNARRYLECF